MTGAIARDRDRLSKLQGQGASLIRAQARKEDGVSLSMAMQLAIYN
jgi:hypothetical protein